MIFMQVHHIVNLGLIRNQKLLKVLRQALVVMMKIEP